MLNIIVKVIALVIIGLSIAAMIRAKVRILRGEELRNGKKPAFAALFVGIVIFIFSCSFKVIPTGYTGIRVAFGQVDTVTIQSGVAWKLPLAQSIRLMDNRQQDITFEGQIWSETSERTAIYYEGVTVTYQINKSMSAWIYANVANYEDNLITQSLVASAVKSGSKTLSSTDATNRGMIEPLAAQEIQRSLDEKYGENTVIIMKVTIGGADFEETYNQAIAQKQNAQLEYERQQIENQKAVEKAEADAQVKRTQANADAEALLIRTNAEAEANRILAESLNENVFRDKFYETWNGVLPAVVSDTEILTDVSRFVGGEIGAESYD